MILTEEQLKAIMPNISANVKANANFAGYTVASIVDVINKYAPQFGIDTKLRMQHFLAQIALECGEFKHTVENLNYSANGLLSVFKKYFNTTTANAYARKPEKIGNRVYADRLGNGSEASGDGFKFRGRGCIQITGKSNYKAYNDYLKGTGVNVDLFANPDLLCKPVGAIKSAMWFWWKNNLNKYADQDSVVLVTRHINGGTNGLTERTNYLKKAKSIIK